MGRFLEYFRRKFTPLKYVQGKICTEGILDRSSPLCRIVQALAVPAETELAWKKQQRDLHWVPGNNGVKENDEADELAKKAASLIVPYGNHFTPFETLPSRRN